MKEVQRFTAYDSMGNRYTIVEYQKGSGIAYKSDDGYPVEKLDRTNFVIHKRNPRTREPFISVYR